MLRRDSEMHAAAVEGVCVAPPTLAFLRLACARCHSKSIPSPYAIEGWDTRGHGASDQFVSSRDAPSPKKKRKMIQIRLRKSKHDVARKRRAR